MQRTSRSVPVVALVMAVLLGSTPGCATLFKSKSTDVAVPAAGEVTVDGMPASGPTVKLSNKSSHTIAFKTASGETRMCTVQSSASSGWVVLGILAGGIGWIVDLATKNWNSLDASQCRA
jgi:hypothetical protein